MIIDIHGHYTTAPKALEAWRNRQLAAIGDPGARPRASELVISDDEIRESIETNQLTQMRQRGSNLTIFSPRASVASTYASPSASVKASSCTAVAPASRMW